MFIIADFILMIHFLLVAFVTLGFFLIPIGCKLQWIYVRNKKLRAIHFVLISIVTTESLIGITCPLTIIEQMLRNATYSKTFINYWLSKIIYWDISSLFFIAVYSLCFFWTVLLWKIFPPDN